MLPIHQQSTFDDLLLAYQLPPPGPSYYAARRALWLMPRSDHPSSPTPAPSSSRMRLEKLLNVPDAVYDDRLWRTGIEKVWKGLAAGGTLKHRLPMNLVMKIIHAAWLRDDTWPAGAVAPNPDDVLPPDASIEPVVPPLILKANVQSG